MLLHVQPECFTIKYMNACIGLQHVSIDIFNYIFSDDTSNILSVHLQVSCTALMVCYTYLLTPWCTVLLEKLTGLQLVK